MRNDFKEKPPGRRWTPEEKEAEIREVCDMYQGVLMMGEAKTRSRELGCLPGGTASGV
jgi:hypothetical protein